MKRFPRKLRVSPVESGDYWRLNDFFVYISKKNGSIFVPKGFKTNFASVPKIFRNIVEPWGKHGKAAVVHDYLYSKKLFERKKSDKIFLEIMEYCGVGWLKRHLMYRLVRLFGGGYYGKD